MKLPGSSYVDRFNSLPPEARPHAICTMRAVEWAIERDSGWQRRYARSALLALPGIAVLAIAAFVAH